MAAPAPTVVRNAHLPGVYLDTCCYQRPVEAAAGNPVPTILAEAEAVAEILSLCAAGRAVRIISAINWYEAGLNREPELRNDVRARVAGADRDVPFDRPAAERAARLGRGSARADRRRDCDGMHLASAVGAGAAVFCTVDKRLLNRGRRADTGDTRVLTPAETLAFLAGVAP